MPPAPGGAQAELLAEVNKHESDRNLSLVLGRVPQLPAGHPARRPGARSLTEFFASIDASLGATPAARHTAGRRRVSRGADDLRPERGRGPGRGRPQHTAVDHAAAPFPGRRPGRDRPHRRDHRRAAPGDGARPARCRTGPPRYARPIASLRSRPKGCATAPLPSLRTSGSSWNGITWQPARRCRCSRTTTSPPESPQDGPPTTRSSRWPPGSWPGRPATASSGPASCQRDPSRALRQRRRPSATTETSSTC